MSIPTNKLVIVYPIPRESAQGLHLATNESSGRRMEKNKMGSDIDTKLFPAYSIKLGKYKTGMYKPWLEDGKQKMENGVPLTLQDYYERKHRRPKGYYDSYPSTKDILNPTTDDKKTYFEELLITLKDGATIFDLSIDDHEMIYECLLEDHKVANSENEWRTYKWPKAEFYIALEQEDAIVKYNKTMERTKAIAALHDVDFTDQYKRIAVSVLQISNTRTVLSIEQCYNVLTEYIEQKASQTSSPIGKFMEVYGLVKTPKGRMEIEARYLLAKALDYRSVMERQGAYTWVKSTGAIVIGENYAESVEFLLNPKKVILIEELRDELKKKGEDN